MIEVCLIHNFVSVRAEFVFSLISILMRLNWS